MKQEKVLLIGRIDHAISKFNRKEVTTEISTKDGSVLSRVVKSKEFVPTPKDLDDLYLLLIDIMDTLVSKEDLDAYIQSFEG